MLDQVYTRLIAISISMRLTVQLQPRRKLAGHVLDLPLCRWIIAARLGMPMCFSSSLPLSLRRDLQLSTRSFGHSRLSQRSFHLSTCA